MYGTPVFGWIHNLARASNDEIRVCWVEAGASDLKATLMLVSTRGGSWRTYRHVRLSLCLFRREVELQVIREDGKVVSTVRNKAMDDERERLEAVKPPSWVCIGHTTQRHIAFQSISEPKSRS